MSLTRQQYDRLRDLRGELESAAKDVEVARVKMLKTALPPDLTGHATHACLTCMTPTSMPEWHRGHRLVTR